MSAKIKNLNVLLILVILTPWLCGAQENLKLKKISPANTESISSLIHELKSEDKGISMSAVQALVEKGTAVVPALLPVLHDRNNNIRFWAVYILGRLGTAAKDALPDLIKAIEDKDKFVRGNVIWALREIDPAVIERTSPSDVPLNDISEDEIAAIEKILSTEPKDSDILIQTIYRLEKLGKQYPSSSKMDQVLFISGRAKIAIGSLFFEYLEKDAILKDYYEKHKDDYVRFLGTMYKGDDFKKLIKNYSESPLAPEATLIIAKEQFKVGECEADVDCHFARSINAFSPFIKSYPAHPKIHEIIDEINEDLRRITWSPRKSGLWEVADIKSTGSLLSNYFDLIVAILDSDTRGDALYPLARAFISVGQFEHASRIYKDLEANYPKYRNAKSMAAHLMFDYSEEVEGDKPLSPRELSRYTGQLSDPLESNRLLALDKIMQKNITNRTLLFSILLAVGDLAEKDKSPAIRKKAIEVIGKLAPQTSFYRSIENFCILYDPDLKLQDFCQTLGATREEVTGAPKVTIETVRAELEAMQREEEKAEELMRRANWFYVLKKDWRFITAVIMVIMALSGIYCYRIAKNRGADVKFWLIIGAINAPISLLYVFFIPRRNKQ